MSNTQTSEVSNVAIIDSRLEAARKLMAELNTQRKALMPSMLNEELAVVIGVTEAINVSAELSKQVSDLRKNTQMSDEQKDQVAAARLAHVRLINTPEVKAQINAVVLKSYLKNFKLKHRTDGRTGVTISGQF